MIARACEWAVLAERANNEIFNITNGDVFVWQNVWPAIAEALGMEVGPPEPCCLAEEMPTHEAEWAAIVKKYGLRAPTSLKDFVGSPLFWRILPLVMAAETRLRPPCW